MTDFAPWLTQVDKDSFAFNYDFEVEGKAEGENDDLIISGYAVEWGGEDREGEFFAPGALKSAIGKFLGRNSHPLCFHHQNKKVLGTVLSMDEDSRGVKMTARVDGATKTHPELGTYYSQIKNGTLGNLSVGGKFYRQLIGGKALIHDMDLLEVSITAVPVDPRPSFEVIAGKALEDEEAPAEEETGPELDLPQLELALETLGKAMEAEPKGDYVDRQALALILAFEQMTNNLPTHVPSNDPDGDARVDNLIGAVKSALDTHAKEAHALAAKLGPLPKVDWSCADY